MHCVCCSVALFFSVALWPWAKAGWSLTESCHLTVSEALHFSGHVVLRSSVWPGLLTPSGALWLHNAGAALGPLRKSCMKMFNLH